MKEERELEVNKIKSEARIIINTSLLGICFTLFALIITIRPEILEDNFYLTLQLVCSIPLMLSSLLARSKMGYTKNARRWDVFGFVTFILSYTFLINVVGIFLISSISFFIGLIFFVINLLQLH